MSCLRCGGARVIKAFCGDMEVGSEPCPQCTPHGIPFGEPAPTPAEVGPVPLQGLLFLPMAWEPVLNPVRARVRDVQEHLHAVREASAAYQAAVLRLVLFTSPSVSNIDAASAENRARTALLELHHAMARLARFHLERCGADPIDECPVCTGRE